jgi:O-antigen/teichoic acid export membrane protein
MAVQAALGAHFVARGQNVLNVAAGTLSALALLAGAIVISTGGLGTSAYALAVLGSEALGLGAVVALLLVKSPSSVRPLPLAMARRMLVLAMPLAVVQVLNVVYLRIDAVMLGAMRPTAEVGQYSVGYQVVALVMALPSLFMTALLPALATASTQRTRTLAQRALEVSASAAVPILMVILTTAPVLISLVSEARFEPGARALQLLALGAACSYGSAVYGNVLIARGMQRRLVRITILVVAVNVVLNLVAIPLWGISGAAGAMAASELLALVLSGRIGNVVLGFRPRWASLAPPLVAGGISGAAAALLWRTPLAAHDVASATAQTAVLLAVYAAVLVSCGGLRPFQGLRKGVR